MLGQQGGYDNTEYEAGASYNSANTAMKAQWEENTTTEKHNYFDHLTDCK